MGILTMCFGGGPSAAAVAPSPGRSIADRHKTHTSASVESPDDLVGLLTQAQQMELQAAFKQFDINGNGVMCVAHRRRAALARAAHHQFSLREAHAVATLIMCLAAPPRFPLCGWRISRLPTLP